MRIAVVGAGGVGGYFGARLADAGHEVGLVARGAHLAAIRSSGLEVHSPLGDTRVRVPATDDPGELGARDAVLVCVKAYDTASTAPTLRPLLADDTAVVSLQNGVDNEETLAAVLGPGSVLGGAAYIFSAVTGPGAVTHTGGPARLVFGEMDGVRSGRAERLLQACEAAGIDAVLSSDVRVVLWTKLAFICATAGMTAAVRLPIGDVRDDPEAWSMFARIAREVIEVGRAEGVPLEPDTPDRVVALAAGLDAGAYSSLHHDLVTGRPMELDALHGTVVGRARRRGLAVPACEAVLAILRPWAARNG